MSTSTSVRLTNEIRDDIVRSAVKKLIQPRRDAAKDKESELASKLMTIHIGAKNMALMAQLPPEYFESGNDVCVVESGGKRYNFTNKAGLKKPANLRYGNPVDLPQTHGVWKDVRAVDAEKSQISKDEDVLRTKMRGILNSCSTVKTLLQAWPEAEEYLPVFATKSNLPAVRSEDLNLFISQLKK